MSVTLAQFHCIWMTEVSFRVNETGCKHSGWFEGTQQTLVFMIAIYSVVLDKMMFVFLLNIQRNSANHSLHYTVLLFSLTHSQLVDHGPLFSSQGKKIKMSRKKSCDFNLKDICFYAEGCRLFTLLNSRWQYCPVMLIGTCLFTV